MVHELTRNASIKNSFFNKSGLYQILVLLTAFCLAMVAFRILYTGEWMFAFLIWNLFLAYLPYSLSSYITREEQRLSKPVLILLLITWLLLIPNSFYIIT